MKSRLLLSRDQFREGVFDRDGHKCVFCEKKAADAHHIMERRLWPDGGYYLDNGASVCNDHHILCETTEISVQQVRDACGIKGNFVPPHLYDDQMYDKWGNPILENGLRMRGDLFFDESVQKILAQGGVLGDFTDLVKYQRTHHLPWSLSINDDDRVIGSLDAFKGQRVIVTQKMDGENTSMYPHHIHARSVDGRGDPSRSWVKQFWSEIRADIPDGWRVCGENLFAQHSIAYTDLPTYFMGFSVWNERNVNLSWDETMEWFELLRITPVPVLYDGEFDEKKIKSLWSQKDWESSEGYVVRLARAFSYGEVRTAMGKFVRDGHLQTVKHGNRIIVRNGLAEQVRSFKP